MRLAAFFFILGAAPSHALGTNWYVDVHADGPGSGTLEDPFPRIQQALDHPGLEPGDLVSIAPGTYTENLVLPDFMSIALEGQGGALRTVLRPADPSQSVLLTGAGNLQARGITFTGVTNPSSACIGVGMGSVRLVNCLIAGNAGAGVAIEFDLDIERCTLAGNGLGIMFMSANFPTLKFMDSILWGNDVGSTGRPYVIQTADSIVQDSALSCVANCSDQDPLFFDTLHNDWTLSAGSPAIGLAGASVDAGAFPYEGVHVPDLETYCPATASSVGVPTFLDSPTRPSISADDFTLQVMNGAPGEFGTFFYGGQSQQTPFGDGVLCVDAGTAGLFRMGPPLLTPGAGALLFPVDLDSAPAGSGPGALLPGTSWYFQFWYRDPQGPGGTGFNLSSALRATFWP